MKSLSQHLNESLNESAYGISQLTPEIEKELAEIMEDNEILSCIKEAKKIERKIELKVLRTSVDQYGVFVGYVGKKSWQKMFEIISVDGKHCTILIDDLADYQTWKSELIDIVEIFINHFHMKSGRYDGEFRS